jgi:hypothetical protein
MLTCWTCVSEMRCVDLCKQLACFVCMYEVYAFRVSYVRRHIMMGVCLANDVLWKWLNEGDRHN